MLGEGEQLEAGYTFTGSVAVSSVAISDKNRHSPQDSLRWLLNT